MDDDLGVVLDPFLGSGDIKASKTLEDSQSVCGLQQGGVDGPSRCTGPSGQWQQSGGPSVIHTHALTPINPRLIQHAASQTIS